MRRPYRTASAQGREGHIPPRPWPQGLNTRHRYTAPPSAWAGKALLLTASPGRAWDGGAAPRPLAPEGRVPGLETTPLASSPGRAEEGGSPPEDSLPQRGGLLRAGSGQGPVAALLASSPGRAEEGGNLPRPLAPEGSGPGPKRPLLTPSPLQGRGPGPVASLLASSPGRAEGRRQRS